MKCIKYTKSKDGEEVVKRVSDRAASDLVAKEGWKYCPKSVWKLSNKNA